jgi:MFS transporter, putative metabolite:H+ symporter
MNHSNAGNRLDRLPIASFHKFILFAVSFAYFFEFADTNTFAVVAPQLIRTWGITVDTVAYITSISFLGMFLGSIIGGQLADKLGRRKALILSVSFFSVFSLLNAAAWDALSLGLFRFLTGMGLAAMTIVTNTYIAEMFPASLRGKYQALAIMFGIMGTPVTTWIARFVIPIDFWTWRVVFLWGSIGMLFLFFIPRLKESPRWLESLGQFDRADAILTSIEAEVGNEKGALAEPEPFKQAPKIHKVPFLELFTGKYLRRTLVLTVVWVTQTVGFFGYSSWAPTLLAQQGFNIESSLTYVALSTLGAPLGSYVASLISDRAERKWTLTIAGVLIAASGLLYGMTFQPALIVIFGLCVNLFERTYTSLAYAYSPELFPAEARATGTSVPYGIGRLSNIAGPLIISQLFTSTGYQSVFMFIAGTWLLGSITLGVFGSATRKRNMDALGEPPARATEVDVLTAA